MRKVVLVEDSPTQAARLKHFLRSYYRIIHAKTATAALEITAQSQPDLVVTDVTMPEMDGFELCRRLKADQSLGDIPVLLLTGLSEPEDIVWGLESGADSYLTKPYDDSELLSRIEFVLTNAERKKQDNEVCEPLEVSFLGKDYTISSSRRQVLGLLLSTYESAARQNRRLNQDLLEQKLELKERRFEAQDALEQITFFLENWPGPVWVVTETGERLWANEDALSMAPLPDKAWNMEVFQGVSLQSLRTTWENQISYLVVGRETR